MTSDESEQTYITANRYEFSLVHILCMYVTLIYKPNLEKRDFQNFIPLNIIDK